MHKVIKTGSTGNAVLYHDCILVDCGVSFKEIKPIINDIQLILLTHEHKDHINIDTLIKIKKERPTVRIGCCQWMLTHLKEFKKVDCFCIGDVYDYGLFTISPVKLFHDVDNCGYRILTEDYKIFHATDTVHLEGVEALNYNLYAIEHNYDEDTIGEVIKYKESKGEYSHEKGSVNSHLSYQQATEFIYNNKGVNSEVLQLHMSVAK